MYDSFVGLGIRFSREGRRIQTLYGMKNVFKSFSNSFFAIRFNIAYKLLMEEKRERIHKLFSFYTSFCLHSILR